MVRPYTPGTKLVLMHVKGRKTRDDKPLTDGAWFVLSAKRDHDHLYLYSLVNSDGQGVGRIPHRCTRVLSHAGSDEIDMCEFDDAFAKWVG